MDRCNWSWVESRVSAAASQWSACAEKAWDAGPRFCPQEQQKREDAYEEALEKVEREAKYARRGGKQRAEAQRRVVGVFPRFATVALGLEDDAVDMLMNGFIPIGTQFAQWARRFDPALPMMPCREKGNELRHATPESLPCLAVRNIPVLRLRTKWQS